MFSGLMHASSTSTITQGLKGTSNLPVAQSCVLGGSVESALLWIGALREKLCDGL